jgi:hypothetical protein
MLRLWNLKDKVDETLKGSHDKIIDALDMVIFATNLAKEQPELREII